MKDDTLLVAAGRDPERYSGVVNPPVFRASTILYPDVETFERPRELRGVYYGRGGTPTTFALEDALAALAGARGAVITGSGKTVIAQALMSFLKAGDHLLMVDSAYAPTRQLCDRVLARFGVETTYYDPLIGAGIAALIRPETRVVFMESPGSLTFEVQDVPAIAAVARARGVLTMLDNTWATPLYFKALEHGVDIDLHAGTKYICGHSDTMIGAGIAALIRPETRVVFMESPGSLTFEVQDVPAIAAVARARGVLTMLDNTWATPLYFKALEHGVDIDLHAGTKYICGHSDTMIGVALAGEALYPQLRHGMYDLGSYSAPDDCYQALKGLRTLSVRLERHQANALELARWLQRRPEVARVLYPALPDDPGHALWRRDFRGACGLFGVLLKPCPAAAWHALVDGLEYFGLGASWGGYESLIMPNHPERYRSATPWDASLPSIRIHAGLEDPADLIADLEAGFARLNSAR